VTGQPPKPPRPPGAPGRIEREPQHREEARAPVSEGTGPTDAHLVGATIARRYHLVRLLGDGGMGAVYKAADTVLRRFVAIKLLHKSTTRKSPAAVDRFQREARAAAAIGHPNIIDILDFGVEEQRPYMVMEYLRGASLSQILATEGQLHIARATSIAAHTLAGLAAAHERGILHRDLKPANLMVVARFGDKNFVKVCDFGFAALMGPTTAEDGKTLTPERTLVGTPAYAAPERLRGDDRRDPRTDVYAVGVLLFEMIAGRRPYDAPTFRELAKKVWNDPPPSLSDFRRNVPAGLDGVVKKALAKDPAARFRSASELAAALVPFGGRNVALEDDEPSDSFSFEVLQLRARDAKKRGTRPEIELPPADVGQKTAPHAALTAAGQIAAPVPSTQPSLTRPPPAESDESDATRVHERPIALTKRKDRVPSEPPERGDTLVALQVKGRFVVSILRFVSRKFGERAVQEVLASMPASARGPFDLGVLDEAWIDGGAVQTLVEHIDSTVGSGDLNTVVECGRAAAEGAFDAMRALKPPSPPPELLISEMPTILRTLIRGMELVVRRVGRGYGRLEVIEHEAPSLTWNVLFLGFFERSLERFGAEDVEVNLIGSRALDDPQTVIDASWIG
jgi:serine/threonine protein kinase